jgi:hypothetical protein
MHGQFRACMIEMAQSPAGHALQSAVAPKIDKERAIDNSLYVMTWKCGFLCQWLGLA